MNSKISCDPFTKGIGFFRIAHHEPAAMKFKQHRTAAGKHISLSIFSRMKTDRDLSPGKGKFRCLSKTLLRQDQIHVISTNIREHIQKAPELGICDFRAQPFPP